MGHLWLFSPPFFVLVWEVKGIVLSSVEYLRLFSAIRDCNVDIPLLQTCLSCTRVLS